MHVGQGLTHFFCKEERETEYFRPGVPCRLYFNHLTPEVQKRLWLHITDQQGLAVCHENGPHMPLWPVDCIVSSPGLDNRHKSASVTFDSIFKKVS